MTQCCLGRLVAATRDKDFADLCLEVTVSYAPAKERTFNTCTCSSDLSTMVAGGEGVVDASDNTQELAELFDATLKFTSVLKKQGVSQSTLTVSFGCWSAAQV